MIIHFHYSARENSGEIRRIKNIDKDVALKLSKEVVEVAFISSKDFFKKNYSVFKLNDTVQIKKYFPVLPFFYSSAISKWLNSYWTSFIIWIMAIKYKPQYVIGEYDISYQSMKFLPKHISMIIDVHGATKEEYEYNNIHISKLLINFFDRIQKKGIEKAKYIICQSVAMKRLLVSKYPSVNPDKFYVYRCGVDTNLFFYDDTLRFTMRKNLGLSADNIVFIYSGGMHKWQRVEDSIEIFHKFYSVHRNSVLIILTLATDVAQRIIDEKYSDIKQCIIIKSIPHNEVCGYLNAADAAFLLRDNIIMNSVAFPTKLAEYTAAGLPVITTDVAMEWIEEKNIIFNIDNAKMQDLLSFIRQADRNYISSYAKNNLSLETDAKQIKILLENEQSK